MLHNYIDPRASSGRNLRSLKISDVQIVTLPPKDGFLGFASLVINDEFRIADLGLHSKPEGGLRLQYPTKRLNDGTRIKIFQTLGKDFEAALEMAVTDKYMKLIERVHES